MHAPRCRLSQPTALPVNATRSSRPLCPFLLSANRRGCRRHPSRLQRQGAGARRPRGVGVQRQCRGHPGGCGHEGEGSAPVSVHAASWSSCLPGKVAQYGNWQHGRQASWPGDVRQPSRLMPCTVPCVLGACRSSSCTTTSSSPSPTTAPCTRRWPAPSSAPHSTASTAPSLPVSPAAPRSPAASTAGRWQALWLGRHCACLPTRLPGACVLMGGALLPSGLQAAARPKAHSARTPTMPCAPPYLSPNVRRWRDVVGQDAHNDGHR